MIIALENFCRGGVKLVYPTGDDSTSDDRPHGHVPLVDPMLLLVRRTLIQPTPAPGLTQPWKESYR